MSYYCAAAEAGNLEAQRLLASQYLRGDGVTRDATTSALWFRKAAEQGDAGAQFQLAAMYCTGAGVVRNLAEAVKWYRRSAELGDRYAQYNLSVMLPTTGLGFTSWNGTCRTKSKSSSATNATS